MKKIVTLPKPNGPKPTINLGLIFRNLQNTKISELGHYAEMIFQNLPKTKTPNPNTIDDVSTSKMTISKSKHQKKFSSKVALLIKIWTRIIDLENRT